MRLFGIVTLLLCSSDAFLLPSPGLASPRFKDTSLPLLTVDEIAAAKFAPPSFNATDEELTFIKDNLCRNFLFQDMTGDTFDGLCAAFEKVTFPKGSVIVKQGDTNIDYLYLVEDGECTVTIDDKKLPDPYGTMTRASIMGELAMLYNSPRAATVTAATNVTAFRLDRASFKHFVDSKPGQTEDIKSDLKKIDHVIDKISGVKTRYGGAIIREFKPQRLWLWSRWHGTILQHAWKISVLNMLSSIIFISILGRNANPTWAVGMTPDANHPVVAKLLGLGKAWHYLMSITTFILTFFLSQAYAVWRKMETTGRIIQGRQNDIGLLLASTVERDEKGRYTPRAEALIDDVASYSRLFHAFAWAKFAKRLEILLSTRGMSRMLSRGIISKKQFETLSKLNPNGGPHNACMMWILMRTLKAKKQGIIPDDLALSHAIYEKLLDLRGTVAVIGDVLDGRIPLAYAHFVQILVDIFLGIAPFALYGELGVWSIPAVGLLTLFYSGLLDLSKIFLDPLDNDDFYEESVNMDLGVLIREGNAGSTRWKSAVEILPF